MANKVNAKCLILNHFSQRYKPIGYVSEKKNDHEEDPEDSSVKKLLDEAKNDFKNEIVMAFDLYSHKF